MVIPRFCRPPLCLFFVHRGGNNPAQPYLGRKAHTNHYSQYSTTHICPFWAEIEAVDSYTLTLKHSIDRIKNNGVLCWVHPNVKNVEFLRCSHVDLVFYLGLLASLE